MCGDDVIRPYVEKSIAARPAAAGEGREVRSYQIYLEV